MLLVLDGLGWEQFEAHRDLMPTLSSMTGRPITHRRPDHDGHRPQFDRHRADTRRARADRLPDGARRRDPERAALDGRRPGRSAIAPAARRATVRPVPRAIGAGRQPGRTAEFGVHRGPPPWRMAASAGAPPARSRSRPLISLAAGERFVYAYYDGVDKIAHERGFGAVLRGRAPHGRPPGRRRSSRRSVRRTAVLVTADHGQVHVGDHIIHPSAEMLAGVSMQSGEGRFRWLHAQTRRDPIGRRRCHRRGRSRGVGRDA